MSHDYLDAWDEDWLSRGSYNPQLAPRAWELRDQGWSYAEIAGHLGVSVAQAYQLSAVRQKYKYEKTPDPISTIAHLLTSVDFNIAHTVMHIKAALKTSGAERQFNLEHADRHAESAAEHGHHLTEAIGRQYPAIEKEYGKIAEALRPKP